MNDDAAGGDPAANPNADEIERWNTVTGENWVAMQDRMDRLFADMTAAAIERAAPRQGEHAIDIGCGCGATTLALAGRVGPDGAVRAVDVSAPMLGRAKERVAEAGFGQVTLELGDASLHRFPPHRADLLFSRFGVMFFHNPEAAFANLHGAMKPGGRLLFVCWRPMRENPFFTTPLGAARPFLGDVPPHDPTAPGPFAFGDRDRTRGILAAGGWRDIDFSPHDPRFVLAPPGDVAGAAERSIRVGPLARLLSERPEADQAAARDAMIAALRPFDGPEGVILPGAVWMVSARA